MNGEENRLKSIQNSVDGFSRSVLAGLPLGSTARCLELGAGAGSIAVWLADRCPDGQVVAVDKDLSHFTSGRPGNLTLVEADVTDPGFEPGEFDLVHARFLLCHLPTRDRLIARAVSWLAPGGWLVIADPYQLPPERSPFPVVQRLMAAYERVHAARGSDLTWSRSVPSLLAAQGLVELGHAGYPGCLGGGERDRWRPLVEGVVPELLRSGLVTTEDVEEFHRALADPAFVDVPQFTLAAWGCRPR